MPSEARKPIRLEPASGTVRRAGRATYLSQDPGRYLVRETAIEEVALGVGGDQVRAQAALERFGLGFAVRRHPRDLSSGERERLGLAAVAVSQPDLLVLDEPTRGVDPTGAPTSPRGSSPRPSREASSRHPRHRAASTPPCAWCGTGGARWRGLVVVEGLSWTVMFAGIAAAAALWAALDPARGGLATLLAARRSSRAVRLAQSGSVTARDLTLIATLGGRRRRRCCSRRSRTCSR
jgi:hypothetical protein